MSSVPHMHPVKSANVESIGHQPGELHVKYKNGGRYVYHRVPADLLSKALAAESPGKFLAEHVKGKFTHTKL